MPVNWATGIDMKTGRPIETPEARYYQTGKPFIAFAGRDRRAQLAPDGVRSQGRAGLHPGATIAAFPYIPQAGLEAGQAQGFNIGIDMGAARDAGDPRGPRRRRAAATKGALIAWDPVAKKERWRVSFEGPWNGGMLSTAGGLVFQGNAAGQFVAYSANGRRQALVVPDADRHRRRADHL